VEAVYTTLVMGIVVLEGISRQLDPDLDLFASSLPSLIHIEPDIKSVAVKAGVERARKEIVRRFEAATSKVTGGASHAVKADSSDEREAQA
jgi:predicted unusual protein kinase regulating ubiquinone biosynthesis (AarF/ABC1/UbiB family)